MDAVVLHTCSFSTVELDCCFLVELDHPVSYSVQRYFFNEFAWELCWDQACIHASESPIFLACLVRIDLCSFSSYIDFGALAISLKICSSRSLVLSDLIPQTFILLDRKVSGRRWVRARAQNSHNQQHAS